MLAIIGHVIALLLRDRVFDIGPYGRLFGLVVALGYFGIRGSRLFGGQTLGMRWLNIGVRNAAGASISVSRSFARTAVWVLPFMLNGWSLPALAKPSLLTALVATVLFGVGFPVAYTMVFNRRTRQGLHDLLFGTYVVNFRDSGVDQYPRTWIAHLILSAIMFLTAVVVIALQLFKAGDIETRQDRAGALWALHEQLQSDPRFFTVSVFDNTTTNLATANSRRTLRIDVWHKGSRSDSHMNDVINGLAAQALTSYGSAEKIDWLHVAVRQRYDLGIAGGGYARHNNLPVDEWRKQLSK